MKLWVVVLIIGIVDAYYSVDNNINVNNRPGLPWNPLTPIRPTNNGDPSSGPPENNAPSIPYPYGPNQYGNWIQWPYGYGPYGPINNNVGGTYGGLSNWPYQGQNWLPWRPLLPQPRPLERKENATGSVVEVPIQAVVEGLEGEKPFPQSNK
uniref:Secreted protein n=1 Tax=Steinernema glaseri TaxID=37863 RepID=A0A1I8A678_9BILA